MEFYEKFVKGLKEAYRERQLYTENQWPPLSREKFIDLQLVQTEKKEGFRAGLSQNELFNSIGYDDLFKVKDTKPVRKIIIEGNAGIGKTTLCTILVEKWAVGQILKQFDCVLLLPLGNQLVRSACSFCDILALYHPDKSVCKSVTQNIVEKRGKGVLIIGDGWDELSETNRSKLSFLYSILLGYLLPSASTLLTSRPSCSASLHDLPSVDLLIEVIGFSKDNIEQYVRSEFVYCPQKAASLIEQLENNPVVQSVCSVPLNCAIICNLWHTLDQELPCKLTELYTKIVLNIVFRNIKKISECLLGLSLNNFDQIPKNLQATFWLTCKFAFECLHLDRYVFSEADLSSYLGGFGEKLQCFGLLQTAHSLLPVGHGLSFHFLHLTIQEYLAALHLVTVPNEEKLKIMKDHADKNRFNMVWVFMIGLARKQKDISEKVICLSDTIFNHFLVPFEYNQKLLCHAAFEASNPDFTIKVGCIFGKHLLSGCYLNNSFDCQASFYVLRHMAYCDMMEILMINCGLGEKLLKELTDILCKANGKLQVKWLYLGRNKLTDKSIADLFHRASASFLALDELELHMNNISDVMKSFMSISCYSLTWLDLSDNPLGVTGLQSLENVVQAGLLKNLNTLELSNTFTEDVDVNMALLTTLLPSISSHCPKLDHLYLCDNKLCLHGLHIVRKNIPLQIQSLHLRNTCTLDICAKSCEYEFQIKHCIFLACLRELDLSGCNFHESRWFLLSNFLSCFSHSLELLVCRSCSLTSSDIIALINHLKKGELICEKLKKWNLESNCIDNQGVIALTECLPKLFPGLNGISFKTHSMGKIIIDKTADKSFIRTCNNTVSYKIIIKFLIFYNYNT